MTELTRRIGSRTNLSPANNASWLLAVAILAIVIPANDKIASNLVFFAAHDVSPIAWAVVLVVGLVVFWAVLAGILWILRRFLPGRAFDVRKITLDVSRAKTTFGWQPLTSIDEGIRRHWDWLQTISVH